MLDSAQLKLRLKSIHHCDTPAASVGWIRRGIGECLDAHPFACHPVSANHAAHVARCTDVLVVARLCRGRRGSPKCHHRCNRRRKLQPFVVSWNPFFEQRRSWPDDYASSRGRTRADCPRKQSEGLDSATAQTAIYPPQRAAARVPTAGEANEIQFQRLNRLPNATEIADLLGVDHDVVVDAVVAVGDLSTLSTDAPLGHGTSRQLTFGDTVGEVRYPG